ncbi:DUF6364 family protein [Kiritimatiellaeota bacterium B1221]|nr:DUF6364 family protein [Kiritimatiellaeota bacterium B1221]
MQTKLTLRLEESLIKRAKKEAALRGTSVSQMVGDYLSALNVEESEQDLSPVTRSFVGVMEATDFSEEDYKRHLKDKHL